MLELTAKLRKDIGRGLKMLRKQNLIPAILYGPKIKNLPLTVDYQDFEKIYQEAGQSTLIKLKMTQQRHPERSEGSRRKTTRSFGAKAPQDDIKESIVLIHDLAKDPVTDKFIHIDFYQVRMDRLLKAEVPLVFVGQSPAVETEAGVLVKNIQKVEIEALPRDLPKEIEIDISPLKTFDDNIHIKDISLPAEVKMITEPEEVVASVIPPRAEAELEELEKAPEEKVEEVEVEGEEKKEVEVEGEVKEKEPSEKEKTE